MKYYSIMRPVGPGTCPEGFTSFENFDDRKYVKGIGRDAWGVVSYDGELTPDEIKEYELIPEPPRVHYHWLEIALHEANENVVAQALRLGLTRAEAPKIYADTSGAIEAKLNWPGLGDVDPKKADAFAGLLYRAASVAKWFTFNGFVVAYSADAAQCGRMEAGY